MTLFGGFYDRFDKVSSDEKKRRAGAVGGGYNRNGNRKKRITPVDIAVGEAVGEVAGKAASERSRGRFARSKGQRGEREAIRILQEVIDRVYEELQVPEEQRVELSRNLVQTREGGFDVVGLEWMALEVKRQERISAIGTWWKQTRRQTGKNQLPVLMYRQNRGKWKIRTRLPVHLTAKKRVRVTMNLELDDFLVYFEHRFREELSKQMGGV